MSEAEFSDEEWVEHQKARIEALEAALRAMTVERDRYKAWSEDHAQERDAFVRGYREACQERDALRARVTELEQAEPSASCEQCGATFPVRSANQRFCTPRCRDYAASGRRNQG